MNIAENLIRTAARHGERTAVRLDAAALTYRQLDAASALAAGWLADLGVGPGDRVGLMLPNVMPFPVLYYGILRAGAVVVPMNPLFRSREVEYTLADAEASLLLAWEGSMAEAAAGARKAGVLCIEVVDADFDEQLAEHAPQDEVVECGGGDTAILLYTSGTTGVPKGAELTHDNIASNVDACVELFNATQADTIFGGLPLFHSFGQVCGLNTAVRCGAELTLLPRFDAVKALEVFQRDQVTIMEGVPTMYIALLQVPDRARFDTSSLRVCVSGGASLPVEVLKEFESEFDAIILEGYGLSETSPVATFNHLDGTRKPGSIGTPIRDVELRLIDDDWGPVAAGDVGEIVIKGPNVMKGYWRRPEATAAAVHQGWLRTGDLAKVDDDGFYFIVDRAKDVIIRGGFNIYPREVEEVLYEHPAVAEVAVLGVPDPVLGEEVAAAITLKPGARATAEELRGYVRERIAPQKYPRRIWFVDGGLPKGSTGKILKRAIEVPGEVGTQ